MFHEVFDQPFVSKAYSLQKLTKFSSPSLRVCFTRCN